MTTTRDRCHTGQLPPCSRMPALFQSLSTLSARRWLLRRWRRHGDLITLRINAGRLASVRNTVLLTRPSHIHQLFSGSPDALYAGESNAVMAPISGPRAVVLADGAEHARLRKLLLPGFTMVALRGYEDLITELAIAEVTSWPLGVPFRAADRMQALTVQVIFQVVFGVTDPGLLARLRHPVESVMNTGPLRLLAFGVRGLRRIPPWRGLAKVRQEFDTLLREVITARRADPNLARRKDVLSRLLRTEDTVSDDDLVDNLVTLLIAGHETTATTMAWLLHQLAHDRELMLRAARAASDGNTAYLEAVIKETMRIHPVLPFAARSLTEPQVMGGCPIPAGTIVAAAIELTQRDPRNFPCPEQFRPERFLGDGPEPDTWIPFGGGARRCLGAGFAMVEMVVVLREILIRYHVRPGLLKPEPERSRHVSKVPAHGARIVVTSR
jgi:cytochrome P450